MLLILNKRKFILKLIAVTAAISLLIGFILFLSDYIVQTSENHDFTQILSQTFDVKNAAIVNNDPQKDTSIYDIQTTYGEWAYRYESERIAYLHKWAEKQGIDFQDIRSTVKVTQTNKANTEYSFHCICSTEYHYCYQNSGDDVNLFRIVTYHAITLTEKDKKWLICNEWCLDPFEYSLNNEEIGTDFIRNCISSGKERDFSSLSENRMQAINYADRYCGASGIEEFGVQYNTDYKNYNGIGGDCTNFISQILYEGGKFRKNSSWNYEKEGSSAWCQASAFLDYMLYSGRASQIASGSYEQVLKASYRLEPGDLISYVRNGRVEHTAVVTGADTKGYALVNCHTVDSYRVPWDLGWNSSNVRFTLLKVNY